MSEVTLLEKDRFESHLGKTFRFSLPGGGEDTEEDPGAESAPGPADLSAELRLDAIEDLPAHAPPGKEAPDRQPFALTFRGPAEPVLQQTTYLLETGDGQGEPPAEAIFIVPLGPDGEGGMLYEAVFN